MRQAGLNLRNILLLGVLLLSACGFHLRGVNNVPFETLYVQDSSAAASISRDLKRSLSTSGVTLVSSPEKAQGSLDLMSETFDKRILSLSGNGRVREYEIIYKVVFRLRNAGEELWGEPQTVEQRRDYTYNDAQTLAKEAEENRLRADMRSDMVRELLRRLNTLSKPAAPNEAAR